MLCALMFTLFSCIQQSQGDETEKKEVAELYISVEDEITKDGYVSCTLKLTDPNGDYADIVDTGASIKVRGHSTSAGEKKPYNIKFSSSQRPLGLGKSKKFCLLANLFDKTLMRNRLSYDMASELEGLHYTPDTEYVEVYLNDVYIGNYLMTQPIGVGSEKVDLELGKNEFLLECEPYEGYSNEVSLVTPIYGIRLGFNEPEDPTTDEIAWFNEFFEKAETAVQSRDIDRISEYFDLDSFVDFYIINELFKNVDFDVSSTRFYIKEGKLYAGPIWDFDLSSGNVNEYEFYVEYTNYKTTKKSSEGFYCRKLWYSELIECNAFKQLVSERYIELQPRIVNLYSDNELGKNRIDSLIDRYGDSFKANYEVAGWDISKCYGSFESRCPADTFEGNVELLRSWLADRNEWILDNLDK